jgi:hypothetical protein
VLTITSGSGVVLNDVGVKPDQQVDLTDDDLLSGVDAQLEAGIKALGGSPRRTGATVPLPPVQLREAA